jgi:hypothetical protein
MSKATVQMCMSTTGLGFEFDSNRQHTKSNPTTGRSFSNISEETTYRDPGVSQYQKQPPKSPVKARRPPPKFDMNLRDLFPDDINHDDLASQSFSRHSQPRFHSQQQSEQAAMQPQRPSQQSSFPRQQQSLYNQINAGVGINASQQRGEITSQYPPPLQQQQQQQQKVQDSLLTTGASHSTNFYGVDLPNVPGLDFLQSIDYGQNFDTTGIDLGFGPGLDFQHDWSDGTGVDMFDGFFFGNATG